MNRAIQFSSFTSGKSSTTQPANYGRTKQERKVGINAGFCKPAESPCQIDPGEQVIIVHWQGRACAVGTRVVWGGGGYKGDSSGKNTWEQRVYFCLQKGMLPSLWRMNPAPPHIHIFTFISPRFIYLSPRPRRIASLR